MNDPNESTPPSDLIFSLKEEGRTLIDCLFENENLWLTQAQMGKLYQKVGITINEHLLYIYEEKKLEECSTIREFRIVRIESNCLVNREISHSSLQAILTVGFRVRSQRGKQFRQWANERLHQAATLGIPNDFDELLKRIISPPGSSWNSFFTSGPPVPDDGLTERASQHQGGRETLCAQ